jgi:hypothetical protein
MALALEDANKILKPLIRTINKRAEYSTSFIEGERPSVLVDLSIRNRSTKVTVAVEALAAAGTDSMRRNQLRTKLKQALDRMLFVPNEIASTKMVRGSASADGFFRPPPGGRGRR